VAAVDLDTLHKERTQALSKRFVGHHIPPAEAFISERAVQAVSGNKILVDTYKGNEVLGLLPYSPVVLAPICPFCIQRENLATFKKLVSANLVMPILLFRYDAYESTLRDFIVSHDHISRFEFGLYRHHAMKWESSKFICDHCMENRVEKICRGVRRRSNGQLYQQTLRSIFANMTPLIDSDEEIMDLAERLCAEKKLEKLRQLNRMSFVVNEIRSGHAINAPIVLKESELANLPQSVASDMDNLLVLTTKLRDIVAGGLSLKIPTDLPVDVFIELVKDYQPKISKIIDDTLAQAGAEASIGDVSKVIANINSEIERVRGIRRYAVLEAGMSFYRNNATLVNAMLLGGAMGITGNIFGCATIAGMAGGLKIAKKRNWIKNSPETERLGRIIARDIQPCADLIMKNYLGSSAPAINVLSLRKRIAGAAKVAA